MSTLGATNHEHVPLNSEELVDEPIITELPTHENIDVSFL